jgi:hypothetical protein
MFKSKYLGKREYRKDIRSRIDRTCNNHGSCPYCTRNRTFASRRRAPLEDVE